MAGARMERHPTISRIDSAADAGRSHAAAGTLTSRTAFSATSSAVSQIERIGNSREKSVNMSRNAANPPAVIAHSTRLGKYRGVIPAASAGMNGVCSVGTSIRYRLSHMPTFTRTEAATMALIERRPGKSRKPMGAKSPKTTHSQKERPYAVYPASSSIRRLSASRPPYHTVRYSLSVKYAYSSVSTSSSFPRCRKCNGRRYRSSR